jgi:5-formyltetrahydrofolate cyclo-ligase
MNSVLAEKRMLRKEILMCRRNLNRDLIAAESADIAKALFDWSVYRQSDTIMAYAAMADEPQTHLILQHALSEKKKLCIPVIGEAKGTMEAAFIEKLADLVPGKYGILAPDEEKINIAQPDMIELILVPGVAFNLKGQRLGMGAGFYDRFLKKTRNATLVGLALQCQIIDAVPCEDHDYLIDYLATKDGIINCKTGKM